MQLKLLITLLLVSSGISAQGNSRWREIGTTSTGNKVYVDPRSVKDSATFKVAEVRTVYAEPASTPAGPITGSRARAAFDCAQKRVAVIENIIYHDERANRVYRSSKPRIPGFSPALTSTFAHVALEHLCAPKP